MKSADEIHQHMMDLKAGLDAPCACGKTRHTRQCNEGRGQMQAVILALGWALGENPDYENTVVRLYRAGINSLFLGGQDGNVHGKD